LNYIPSKMRAAVIKEAGAIPKIEDFPKPIPQNENQVLIKVRASALQNITKALASGKHYASYKTFPIVVGFDGVGELENGDRVYTIGNYGMFAEYALVPKDRQVKIPKNLDDATAAAIPNGAFGSAQGLFYKSKFKKGDVVLINGGTGFTGKIAIQIAKIYGASKVIVTGRNQTSLDSLKELGADITVSLLQDDQKFIEQISKIHKETPIDVVLDYLWGHSIENIINSFKVLPAHRVDIVNIGMISGDNITISANSLRSSGIFITGSGVTNFEPEDMKKFWTKTLPEIFDHAAHGKIKVETTTLPLANISQAWSQDIDSGKRLVITI